LVEVFRNPKESEEKKQQDNGMLMTKCFHEGISILPQYRDLFFGKVQAALR
jgi:hypothetical protein